MKGYTTIQIGDKKRPLHFGTNQTYEFCKIRECTLGEYYILVGKLGKIAETDGGVIRDLVYSALWAGAMTDEIEIDFNAHKVGNWIDEIGVDGLKDVFITLTESLKSGDEKEGKKEEGKKK
jgi:hypothetical protein